MGSVADKIAKKILSSRGSKVVDLASWREGRTMALEAGFGDDGPAPGKLAGPDPCHAPPPTSSETIPNAPLSTLWSASLRG